MQILSSFVCDSTLNSSICIKHNFMLHLGHGGPGAADYVKKNLFKNLIEHPNFLTDTKNAISIKHSLLFWDIIFE